MSPRSWIIGHDPGCDVVVPHDFVSTRHCRLSQTATGFLLEDLGSTNGTFLNGERLSAPRPVTPRDTITLGQKVAMPWPPAALAAAPSAPAPPPPNGRVITIGRTPDNDVVLDYPMVSTRHARIVVDGPSMTIEDLGSTNGTFLGSLDRRITRSPLHPSDTVYFGTQPFPASRLLGGASPAAAGTMAVTPEMLALAMAAPTAPVRAGATLPVQSLAAPPGLAGGKRRVPPLVIASAAFAGLALLIIVGVMATRGSKTPPEPPPFFKVPGPPPTIPPGVPLPPGDVRRTVYVVLVDSRGGQRQRVLAGIGTATAISESRLATSGSVVTEVQRALAESWDVSVYCPDTKQEHRVVRGTAHPEFQAALGEFNREKGNLDSAMEEMESLRPPKDDASEGKAGEKSKKDDKKAAPPKPARPPPTAEEGKALIDRAIKAEEAMLKNNERMIFFDLGTLEVEGKLPDRVSLAEGKPEAGGELRLIGMPKDPKDPETTRSEMKQLQQDTGRYRGRPPLAESPGVTDQDVFLRSNPDPRAVWNWAGSPLLDGDGRLFGIYSRVTPPRTKDEVPDGKSSDFAPVSRWKELKP
jgi:pSer/pThr/pTyr-binding forkhead associated (FHA) protein